MKSKGYINVSERKVLLRLIDAFLIIAIFSLSSLTVNFEYLSQDSNKYLIYIITLVFYFNLFGQIFQLYSLNVSSNRFRIVQSLFLTTFVTTLFYIFTPYFSPPLPEDRMQIMLFFFFIFIPILLWRFAYTILLFSPKYFKSIVVISHSSRISKLHKLVHNDRYHNVIAYVSDKNEYELDRFFNIDTFDLRNLYKKSVFNEIVFNAKGFTGEQVKRINKDIVLLFEEGISIKSYETFYEENSQSVPEEYLSNEFFESISLGKGNDSRFYYFFHRTVDIIISIIGLVLLTLLLPFIFILNIFGNRGPLFYTQSRVGEKGRVFKIYKLRTMIPDAEKDGIKFAVKNDKRITLFGRFLRNTRLDETPQFLNILKAEMSLIGPRPERPEVVTTLEEKVPLYGIRHVIKPGLTGWAQVCYPYAGTIEEQTDKLRYDLYYIKKQSLYLDFKIFIKTFTTILFFRGQ